MAKARRRDPEKTREEIDRAALDLFAEKGFAGTATSEIAKRAGVAEGTIFRHYPTKKALLIGVMRPLIENVVGPFATRTVKKVLRARYESTDAFLRALISDRIDLAKHLPGFFRVALQEASLHAEVRGMIAGVFAEHVVPGFREQLGDLQARGLVAADVDVGSAIRIILSVVAGYVLFAHVLADDPERFDDPHEIDQIVRVLSRGLAPSP